MKYMQNHQKRIISTNKIVVKHVNQIWSIDLLDMSDYSIKNNNGYRYIFVIIDDFSKYLFTIPLKNKNAQTITNEFSNILSLSKRSPIKIHSDRGKEFHNSVFQNFLKLKNIDLYSTYTDKGAVIAERVNKTIRNLLKKLVFERGDSRWLELLPIITKKYNNTIHHSTKFTPVEASKSINEDEVFFNLRDKRKKRNPKYKLNDLVRTADKRNIFSKFDSTNWSYNLYKITEIIDDTIPSYRINNLPERYNEALLQKSRLTLAENNKVMKKLNLT